MAPKDVPVSMPGTCEYFCLHGESLLVILDYPEGSSVITRPLQEGAGGVKSVAGYAMTEARGWSDV